MYERYRQQLVHGYSIHGRRQQHKEIRGKCMRPAELAASECIKEGILKDFLLQNRAEVISMSIFEYDQEKILRLIQIIKENPEMDSEQIRKVW